MAEAMPLRTLTRPTSKQVQQLLLPLSVLTWVTEFDALGDMEFDDELLLDDVPSAPVSEPAAPMPAVRCLCPCSD